MRKSDIGPHRIGPADTFNIGMAQGYAGIRVAHSLIQITVLDLLNICGV